MLQTGHSLSLLHMHFILHGPQPCVSLSNSALGEKSLLLHLPCLFQPPLELSAAEAFNLLQKREWGFSGPMLHMACALPSAGLYINPQRLLILPRVPARKQSS